MRVGDTQLAGGPECAFGDAHANKGRGFSDDIWPPAVKHQPLSNIFCEATGQIRCELHEEVMLKTAGLLGNSVNVQAWKDLGYLICAAKSECHRSIRRNSGDKPKDI
jgi:hypothetical protein